MVSNPAGKIQKGAEKNTLLGENEKGAANPPQV